MRVTLRVTLSASRHHDMSSASGTRAKAKPPIKALMHALTSTHTIWIEPYLLDLNALADVVQSLTTAFQSLNTACIEP